MSWFIGLFAGVFGGLLGVGGGVIMIPLMVKTLRMGQHRAHGTSLVAVVFTGLSGALTYAWHGSLDWKAGLVLAVTAIITARSGAHFAGALPEWKLKRSFGAFLIFVSSLLLAKPYLPHLAVGAISGWSWVAVLLAAGGFTGFLSGMMGVGGGTIMVPAMVLLLGYDQHTANGTSLLVMVPAGAMGAWAHWSLKNVESKLLPGLVPGVLLGTLIGGSIAQLLPEEYLRMLFAVVLIWLGLRYLRTAAPRATVAKPAAPQ
jgi:uncharacterized membrane protein YfcA